MLLAPRLLPLHVLGAAAVVAAVLLGLWQLDVWKAHRAAEARDISSVQPVALDKLLGPDDPFPSSAVGHPVDLTGAWLPGSTFYVTDRRLDGRTGYWVVTPVAVCEQPAACKTGSALLVVRGWTPDPADAPPPPKGEVRLTGWLQPAEGSGVPDPDPADDRLPELRIADAIQRVDQDLYGAYLIAREAAPQDALAGLERVTPESLPKPSSATGLRNLLYAVQWWVFAGFAVFVWWRWARDEVQQWRRSRDAAAGPEPDGV